MVVYLDTSNLVKLYVEEEGSPKVAEFAKLANATATSLVAYAEARAAFVKRFKEKSFTAPEYKRIVSSFNQDWNNYLIMRVTKELVRLAGNLAEKHSLRGFDAIHLSSAITLWEELAAPVVFSCADRKLQKASRLEGLDQPQ